MSFGLCLAERKTTYSLQYADRTRYIVQQVKKGMQIVIKTIFAVIVAGCLSFISRHTFDNKPDSIAAMSQEEVTGYVSEFGMSVEAGSDIYRAAQTLQNEACGYGKDVRKKIVHIMINRINSPEFKGSTFQEVLDDPGQWAHNSRSKTLTPTQDDIDHVIEALLEEDTTDGSLYAWEPGLIANPKEHKFMSSLKVNQIKDGWYFCSENRKDV